MRTIELLNRSRCIVIIALFSNLFSVCILLSFFILFQKKDSLDTSKKSEMNIYQTLSFNPSLTEYSSGFMTSYRKIEESVTHESESSLHTLVSELGSDEYLCTGSCYCAEDENATGRRGYISSSLKTGMVFLVSSVSSVIVYRKAQDYFTQQCSDDDDVDFDGFCPNHLIQSEVEECTKLSETTTGEKYDVSFTVNNDITLSDGSSPEGGVELEPSDYMCYGVCIPNSGFERKGNFGKDVIEAAVKEVKNYDCEQHSMKGKVTLPENTVYSFDENVKWVKDQDSLIRHVFSEFFLDKFCQKSTMKQFFGKKQFWKKKEKRKDHRPIIPLCVGVDFTRMLVIDAEKREVHGKPVINEKNFCRKIVPQKKEEQSSLLSQRNPFLKNF